jgi:GTP-binding protein LepA
MTNTTRNFSIIAHIDHGKSTLADRMLELTSTVEKRKMKEQVLDSMDLERERGITIKMQPVTMHYHEQGVPYTLNLIDTPGHIDFYYEVSRALRAVEGAILLVDCTQGVQAQTLSTLRMAQQLGLVIIPVLSKVDSPLARVPEVQQEVVELLHCTPDEVLTCSGKTGEGVAGVLSAVIARIPPPVSTSDDFRGLVFDFQYSTHRGVIVYVRVLDGVIAKGKPLAFKASGEKFVVVETGIFSPEEREMDSLEAGSIGYIVTGIKKPGVASVGDTLTLPASKATALDGYMKPAPVIWASLYPESQDDFTELRQALERLNLSDSSLSFEEETSGIMGRGFRCGFLGMLHLEIITERLRREFNVNLVVTTPSITYEAVLKNGERKKIYSPLQFPEFSTVERVLEPWVAVEIITPFEYIGIIMQVLFEHEAQVGDSENFGDGRTKIHAEMPLRELMRNFFDRLKNISSGFGSISYEFLDMRPADVVRLDVLIAEELVPAFSRVVSRRRVEEEGEQIVERLYNLLPQQQFVTKIQAKALGRILSARRLAALRKDVTGYLYGGDITRKRKLWEKQKRGKKRMQALGKVTIPQEVFLKVFRSEDTKKRD